MIIAALSIAAFATDIPLPDSAGADYDLEVLYHEQKFEEGLKVTKDRLTKSPDDKDLYWHAVRFMYEIGEHYGRDDKSIDKVAWYTEMAGYAETGLKKWPEDPHLQFAKGIALARLGTTKGVLATLSLADDVESAWLFTADSGFKYRSLGDEEYLPCDAQMAIGVFYRLVPDSWIVEAISGTRGSLDKAVSYLEKSDACYPNRMATLKELGVAKICRGQKNHDDVSMREGVAALAHAAAIPPKDATDYIDLKHIAGLLADSSTACGYSRDGQQDLDEKKLAKQKTP